MAKNLPTAHTEATSPPEQMPSWCRLWPSVTEAKGPVPGHISEGAAPLTAAGLLRATGIPCLKKNLKKLWWVQFSSQTLTGFNGEQDLA